MQNFKNKREAEIWKRMITLSDENLKTCFKLSRIKLLLPPTAKIPNKKKRRALITAKCSVLMTVR